MNNIDKREQAKRDTEDGIEVLRVLHGRRDIEAIFEERI